MSLWKRLTSPRELLLKSFGGALGGDDWRQLLDFVSPTFFDVVPLRQLLSQGRELVGNATNRSARAEAKEAARKALSAAGLAVVLERGEDERAGAAAEDAAADDAAGPELGQRALEIYFAQLYHSDTTLLDLRGGRFAACGEQALWSPRPYFVRWQPEFLDALRSLYRGFYAGDEATFDAALRELDLAGSKDLFQRHFGAGDPEAVEFDTSEFISTFHDVFLRCRDQGVTLHRNFLPLGIYLAALHEHLGALGGRFRVRSAFERASAGSRQPASPGSGC